jgi:3-oxoacyl-[acyl-carrier protein] reductase
MATEEGYTVRRLQAKVAIVTGASRGIGRAIALRLAGEGAAVAVNYLSQSAAAHETVDHIRRSGGEAAAIQADVADRSAAERLAAQTVERFGRLDILVNNAGVMSRSDLLSYDASEFERLWRTNVEGVIHMAAAVVPSMKQQKSGSIVNLVSVAALGTAMPGTTFYAATKAAVAILTKRFALELGPLGITVNAVAPGFIATDMAFVGKTPEEVQRTLQAVSARSALGRTGLPENIASVVAFLVSPDAAFLTGQILTADGGRMDFLSHSL